MTGCLDTSDPNEDTSESTLPVVSSDLPDSADLPEGDQGDGIEEDIPGEEVDLAVVLGETQTYVPFEGEGYPIEEEEEYPDDENTKPPVVVEEQPPLDKPPAQVLESQEGGDSVPVGQFVQTVSLGDDDPEETQKPENENGNDPEEELRKPEDESGGFTEVPAINAINIPPEDNVEDPPPETPNPSQEQKTRRRGQPSKVKTGNEEQNGVFMFIEEFLTPVVDWIFGSSDEDLPEDIAVSFRQPSSVVAVAVPPLPPNSANQNIQFVLGNSFTSTATTTPISITSLPPAVHVRQNPGNEADSVSENREQYQAAETGLYKFFFTNSEGFLFLGLQKTLSDGREVFLLMEDKNKTHFVLHGQTTQDLLSIESQINFLKTEIVGDFNQYLIALCSYHSPLGEEPVSLKGHDWLVLSVEFGAFFPDKFHHPFIESRYVISDVQKDDNGVVEEVILVHLTDDQQIYTLNRDVEFNAGSLESLDVNQEIEEYILSMESFFNNQDTLCLSSADSSVLGSSAS